VTAKRDSKSKPKKDERPKLKRETLRDLSPSERAEGVRGGYPIDTGRVCPSGVGTGCQVQD
jgi:hypothetical protein